MPTITDWIMVFITAIYVGATIAIFKTNKKSEKAAYAQLDETKRQYEDKKRLEIMPYLQCEKSKGNPTMVLRLAFDSDKQNGVYSSYPIEIVNIGNGTAKDIAYIFTNASGSYNRDDLPQKALQSGNRMSMEIQLKIPDDILGKKTVSIDLVYRDLLDNLYSQKIEFFIVETQFSRTISKHRTFNPKLITKEGEKR